MTHGSLFSGIGGFDLGFEWAGIETVWQVESDEWCRKLLAKRFPEAKRYGEIESVGAHNLEQVDIITGGFPCQPVSVSGKGQGDGDDRWLWPQMLRVVAALRPCYAVVENVPGLLSHDYGRLLKTVCSDLEAEGYEVVGPLEIPACAFGALHLRYREFFVAHASGERTRQLPARQRTEGQRAPNADGCRPSATHPQGIRCTQFQEGTEGKRGREGMEDADSRAWWDAEPDMGRVVHGVPPEVDRLRGLGNAVVPQIAEWLGQRILMCEERA